MIKNKILPFLAATLISINSSLAADLKQATTAKLSSELNGLKNNFIGNAITSLENLIIENIPNTEASITASENQKPEWEIITVQPLIDNGEDITFFQGSLLRWDGDRDTINLGIGQRKFLMNKNIMIGVNTFYDHELEVDHSRLGLGTELITSVGEARYNIYSANSNAIENLDRGAGAKESVYDGRDFELGTHIPYIPAWKIYAKYFEWDLGNIENNGYTYTSEFNTPFGLIVSAGLTKYDNSKDEQPFIKISYSSINKSKDKKITQNSAYSFNSVEDKKLTKVRRENKIKIKKIGFTVSAV